MSKINNFKAKIVKKEDLADSIILISLSAPEGFEFEAGQFVTLVINKEGEKKPRSYSILNPPSKKGKIDLCIKIVEGGFASEIFRNLKIGDEFEVKGPFGHFKFEDDENEEAWLLCAGTGVVPFYSILKEHLEKSSKKFVLLFGARTQNELCFNKEFLELEKSYERFTYKPVISREDWDGLKGHVQDHLPENLKNKTFYICGLKELVLETKEKLSSSGVDPKYIKSERYS